MLKNVVIDEVKTLGDLFYIGAEPAYEYKDNKRTENIIGYNYNLASSVQGDTIKVKVLGDKKEFEMMQKVALVGLETRIYATSKNNFANVNFSLIAFDIKNA
jgi:hypothetical protein